MYLRECAFTYADLVMNPFYDDTTNYVDFPPEYTTQTEFNKVGRMKTGLFEIVIILHD